MASTGGGEWSPQMLKKGDWELVGGESKRIHEQGVAIRDRDAKVEQHKAQKLASKIIHQAKQASEADSSHAKGSVPVESPVTSAHQIPQTAQKDRVEAVHTYSEQAASSQFHKATNAAKQLQQLSSKVPVGGSSSDAAKTARGAVAPKTEVSQAHVQQKPLVIPSAGGKPQTTQGTKLVQSFVRAEKTLPKTDNKTGHEPPITNRVVTDGALAAAGTQSAKGNGAVKHADVDRTSFDSEKEPEPNSSISSNGAPGSHASRGLKNLESGVSADAGGEGEAELPTTDPTFLVFSEFDEARPGVEVVKSKAQILERYVTQGLNDRLAKISEFDQKLTDGLRPLVERVMTDDPELKKLLVTSRFMKNVYGMTS